MQNKKRRIATKPKTQSTLSAFFASTTQTENKSSEKSATLPADVSVSLTAAKESDPRSAQSVKKTIKEVLEVPKEKPIIVHVERPIKMPLRKSRNIQDSEQDLSTDQAFTDSIYTQEFNEMCETVLEKENHLFSERELFLFRQFDEFQNSPKDLIVRLLMRTHKWIKQESLNYNIPDIQKACETLHHFSWVETEITDAEIALNVLTKDELKSIAKDRHICTPEESNSRKCDYIKDILNHMVAKPISYGNTTTFIESRTKKIWDSINQHLGPCIYVKQEIFALFQRLRLVYYRSTSLYDTNPISQSILSKMSRRNYPSYECIRSNEIWSSRDDLVKFEQAMLFEKQLEEILQDLPGLKRTKTKVSKKERTTDEIEQLLLSAWSICETKISIWDEYINVDQERPYFKRRFEAGWIYTRLMDRGTEILARLHEYEMESLILKKLLSQRIYRLGKRGKWYERLALIQMTYLGKKDAKATREQRKQALETCISALHDPTIHQIYIHSIHERINRLERQLCIPKREQHDFSYMRLKKPKEINVYGERLSEEITGKKSVWRTNNGAECSVEQVALEYYSLKGFKGLHAENGIVRTIASLLFWDIIFASIPGVFETPYQKAPLDLRSDAFYESRIDLIQKRLNEIEAGDYLNIIRSVDERERPNQTICTGVNWNYELQDILEIAECIGSSSLASLCELLFQEYSQRQSGMPDLCCWNYEKKECLFSEVKGPGDILSQTQKLWIESLTRFGVQVEVCFVKLWKGDDILLEQ